MCVCWREEIWLSVQNTNHNVSRISILTVNLGGMEREREKRWREEGKGRMKECSCEHRGNS